MHTDYRDIRDLIPVAPLWFDEHAVPRYKPFSPLLMANIYAREAVLIRIECQGCGHEFLVAMSRGFWAGQPRPVRGLIEEKRLRFGDPPNIKCCDAGPSMSSIPKQVVEYWVHCSPSHRPLGYEEEAQHGWLRDRTLEVSLT